MPLLEEGYVHRVAVPAGKKDILVFDDGTPGFALRKFASGQASYICKYNIDGLQRRITLKGFDPFRAGDLEDARAEAKRIRRLAKRDGVDERVRIEKEKAERRAAEAARRAEKRAARERKGAARMLGEIIAGEYLEHRRGKISPSHWANEKRYLERAWLPLHRFEPNAITNVQVRGTLSMIAEECGEVTADRAKAALSTLFGWLIEKTRANGNPVSGIRAIADNEARERDRNLTREELRTVWRAVEGTGDYEKIVRLCILTGARKNEIAKLSPREVDLEEGLIVLPSVRVKNRIKGGFLIPLSDEAVAILREVKTRPGKLLFGAGDNGFSGWSKAKTSLDKRLPPDMEGWVLHDLRRTLRTGLSRLRVPAEIAELCINHKPAGVKRVYDRYDFLDERRQAFLLWGQYVSNLSGDQSNVVPLAVGQR
jgi:integrase